MFYQYISEYSMGVFLVTLYPFPAAFHRRHDFICNVLSRPKMAYSVQLLSFRSPAYVLVVCMFFFLLKRLLTVLMYLHPHFVSENDGGCGCNCGCGVSNGGVGDGGSCCGDKDSIRGKSISNIFAYICNVASACSNSIAINAITERLIKQFVRFRNN